MFRLIIETCSTNKTNICIHIDISSYTVNDMGKGMIKFKIHEYLFNFNEKIVLYKNGHSRQLLSRRHEPGQ